MPCEWYKDAYGNVIHMNVGRSTGRKPVCAFCRRPYREGRLCDFPLGNGKTCDAQMCTSCAVTLGSQETPVGGGLVRLGDTIDVCPYHRQQAAVVDGKLVIDAPTQGTLFEEVR